MLALFRKKHRGLKWILWVVIVVLGGGMVLLFVDTPTSVVQTSGRDVALVNGHPISAAEFRRHYGRLYEYFDQIYRLSQQDPNLIRQLGIGQQALNQLIAEYAVFSEAEKLGIIATQGEVARLISSFPAFQENGQFIGVQRYEQILRANNLTPRAFEDSIRRDVVRDKLRKVVTDGILVTLDEVRQEFMNRHQEVKVHYVSFDPETVFAGDLSDETLREFFEENQENYRTSERRQVRLVSVPLSPDEVEITEEQIRSRIETLPSLEQVRVSHILIGTPPGEDDPDARRTATEILGRIRAGEDFGELARQYSEDPGSAARGGDLGFFGRGQMVPEFETVAFSLEPGEVSDLVRTDYGFHIIKGVATTGASEDPRRPIAEYQVRHEAAERGAREVAARIAQDARGETRLEDVALRHGLSVTESPPFSLGEPVPDLAVGYDFMEAVFQLPPGGVTEPFETPGGFVVAELADVRPADMPSFEEVRDQVREDYISRQKEDIAQESASNFYREARQASSFEEAARQAGLRATTTGFFTKGSDIDDTLKFSPEVHERAFRLNVGHVSSPVRVAGKYVVFQIADKSPLDEERFEREKEQLAEELAEQKRNTFFAEYVQNMVDQLQRDNRITINQELVNQLVG